MKIRTIATIAPVLLSPCTLADDFKFSLSGGWPYLVSPEVSFLTDEGQNRWYASYRAGLDDGFALGYEHRFNNSPHALGLVAGAIGIRDEKDECEKQNEDDTDNTVGETIGTAIGTALGCAFSELLDDETINGVAMSYSYYFADANRRGWSLRGELGYGEGHHSGDKDVTGGLYFRYQF